MIEGVFDYPTGALRFFDLAGRVSDREEAQMGSLIVKTVRSPWEMFRSVKSLTVNRRYFDPDKHWAIQRHINWVKPLVLLAGGIPLYINFLNKRGWIHFGSQFAPWGNTIDGVNRVVLTTSAVVTVGQRFQREKKFSKKAHSDSLGLVKHLVKDVAYIGGFLGMSSRLRAHLKTFACGVGCGQVLYIWHHRLKRPITPGG